MTLAANLLPTLQRAQALHQAGRNNEAWMMIAPLRRAIDQHGQALRLYALIAQSVARIDEALDGLSRIISLEREPPEIIGATADMLGKAGRYEEALDYWDRLVRRAPEQPDAHLNKAVTAADAGKHELAIDAAETGLARFPGHARLLAVKAMALKNCGRIEESVALFETAVAADPNRALTRHNQAVALRAACCFDEAVEAFAASERLGMKGAQFHANWAAAALEAGQIDKAAEEYRKALANDPAHKESLEALTRLQIEYRGGDSAFAHYEDSVRRRGSSAAAWLDWANALIANYHQAEAAEVAEEGLRHHPGDVALLATAAFGAGMSGDAGQALERLAAAYADRGDSPLPWMAQLALRSGDPQRAANYAEQVTAAEPENQGAWAVLSIAWRLMDDPREQWLCDYDRLVIATDVVPPDGRLGAADYAREMATALDPLHLTKSAPGNQSLRDGTQTSGNLFDRTEPAIREFRDAVRIAAELAIARLPCDPQHPFLRRKSKHLDFSGSWSVRLRGGGGHHVAHFHNQGWMSSAYYARLPRLSEQEWRDHEGWIQFGVPPAMYGLDLSPRRVVEPREGRLVLFPSYMFHGTLPFSSGDRLTAAFDYLPA